MKQRSPSGRRSDVIPSKCEYNTDCSKSQCVYNLGDKGGKVKGGAKYVYHLLKNISNMCNTKSNIL